MDIRPFRGYRPIPDKARQVACRPYDVLNSDEARIEAEGNPYSFLNVVKPEISLAPDIDEYSSEVYQAGKENFASLLEQDIFIQDEKPCLYIYELVMNGRSQTGIVACASVDDYLSNRIKKHELTRPDKENDRKNHVRVSMLNAEPVFFAYRAVAELDAIVNLIKAGQPLYQFIADDGVEHIFWRVEDAEKISSIRNLFSSMDATYVADGHHRTAAAALVGDELRKENPGHTGDEGYNYFLAVHFPDDQLEIIDYNRLVKDLNGHDSKSFLEKLEQSFDVNSIDAVVKPRHLHQVCMYLPGQWYTLDAKSGTYNDEDPIAVLDVTILSKQVLEPVLGITDLRTDKRIEFVGGIRGLEELQKRVDSGEMAVAFAMFPVSMQQLMDIADNDLIMPPKVTWFEPKLRSGLIVNSLED